MKFLKNLYKLLKSYFDLTKIKEFFDTSAVDIDEKHYKGSDYD